MVGEKSTFSFNIESIPLENLNTGNNLLQTGFWGLFKSRYGWKPRGFTWAYDGGTGSLLVLEKKLPGGLGLGYIPYGPVLPENYSHAEISDFLVHLAGGLAKHFQPSCFMLRFDLTSGTRGSVGTRVNRPGELEKPLCKAPYRIQPQDTVILSLAGEKDEILSKMHKKTRYNIRLAARKGVEIRLFEGRRALEFLPKWYFLYKETGRRDAISLHSEAYYRQLFEESAHDEYPCLKLYMAEHEGRHLAGIIVSHCGNRATYMYGASASSKRELMPNYLLQWQAIQDAVDAGLEEYDFFGIPPSSDANHPMHGLWRFKTGFGGSVHHYIGAWDYPYRPTVYKFYTWAERIRSQLRLVRKRNRSLNH